MYTMYSLLQQSVLLYDIFLSLLYCACELQYYWKYDFCKYKHIEILFLFLTLQFVLRWPLLQTLPVSVLHLTYVMATARLRIHIYQWYMSDTFHCGIMNFHKYTIKYIPKIIASFFNLVSLILGFAYARSVYTCSINNSALSCLDLRHKTYRLYMYSVKYVSHLVYRVLFKILSKLKLPSLMVSIRSTIIVPVANIPVNTNSNITSLNWSHNGSKIYTLDSLSRNRCQRPLTNCHTAETAGK